ncbi:nuclear transcription factor Y subunit C-2 isoform X2 [Jatropha curcas]|nr:nuclear transcription factor Y subunit C-2 isoform X2 [Jatropha curcas]
MDLNQSTEFNPSSNTNSPPPIHHFMPISNNFMFPNYHYQPTKQDCQEARHSRFMQMQKQNLDFFWNQQLLEIQTTSACKTHHQLPLARIKRIMKSDGEVKMISADTPILFSKACELFILELTLRAWLQTEECKRRTLQRCDIARAIRHDDALDFLVDVVPHDHDHDHGHPNKEDESGKYGEANERVAAIQVPFPMIDINEDLVLTDHEIAEQFMMRSPMPSAEFSFEPHFKVKPDV